MLNYEPEIGLVMKPSAPGRPGSLVKPVGEWHHVRAVAVSGRKARLRIVPVFLSYRNRFARIQNLI